MNIRIAKYISNSGHCSRREAEKLIRDGRVKINNQICDHPSQKVNNEDIIKINKKIIKINNKVEIWKLYKPIKYICSNKDNLKRKKIFDLLPNKLTNLKSVGRLDFMSEGLILLTNNGDYARFLELPSTNLERIYRVCVINNVRIRDVQKVNNGIIINGMEYNKVKLLIEKKSKEYLWFVFKLREGKNREIRNICKFFSWNVVKLIRISYGPYKLGNLKVGQLQKIKMVKHD